MPYHFNKMLGVALLICIISLATSSVLERRITAIRNRFCGLSDDQKRSASSCAINNYPVLLRDMFTECTSIDDNEERMNTWVEVFKHRCPNASLSSTATEILDCVGRKLQASDLNGEDEDVFNAGITTIWENCVTKVVVETK